MSNDIKVHLLLIEQLTMQEETQKLLNYCCIMLHDRAKFGYIEIPNDKLIELFIRNSLQVRSTSRVKEYFESHIAGRSVIYELTTRKVRKWARFHNSLRKRSGYEFLVPLTPAEQSAIKDIRFVQYKILAYEVEHCINGIKSFDCFFQRRLTFTTPNTYGQRGEEENLRAEFIVTGSPDPKIRSNLPQIKVSETSGSDVEDNDSHVAKKAYGFCDDQGINELMVQTTIHSNCSCVGKLRHFIRKSFFKPTVIIECTAHGRGCNIGRMKAINLTQATTLKFKDREYQCSSAATKLTGAVFESGLNMARFVRAVRHSGLTFRIKKPKLCLMCTLMLL